MSSLLSDSLVGAATDFLTDFLVDLGVSLNLGTSGFPTALGL